MDALKVIQSDLDGGFTKSDLERLIGLPINSLSNVLNGHKKLSKKSILKIEKWDKSEKPNPLEIKIVDATKPTNIKKPFEQPKTNYTINTKIDKEEKKHKLWKQGDPTEGSNAFYLRYGARTYDEIEK